MRLTPDPRGERVVAVDPRKEREKAAQKAAAYHLQTRRRSPADSTLLDTAAKEISADGATKGRPHQPKRRKSLRKAKGKASQGCHASSRLVAAACIMNVAAACAVKPHVHFGAKEMRTFVVKKWMWQTPPIYTGRDYDYRHEGYKRNLSSSACAKAASSRGFSLQRQLYPEAAIISPAAANVEWISGPMAWVADTGCGHDLIGRDEIPEFLRHLEEPAESKLTFHSANGETTASRQIGLQSGAIGGIVTPLILKSTPAVLSVGRRCLEEGYEFEWKPYQQPRFWTPKGDEVPLATRGFVPYIVECLSSFYAAPAVDLIPADAQQPAADEAEAVIEAAEEDEEGSAPGRRDLVAEATSIQHLMTHLPKNPHCKACQRAKMQKKPNKKKGGKKGGIEITDKPFGTIITADHLITNSEEDQGIKGERAGVVVADLSTKYFDCYAVLDKDAIDAEAVLSHFVGPSAEVKSFYSDESPELVAAARSLQWSHDLATPGRPQTNGEA